MKDKKIFPTSDLGFRKTFSTKGKEYILQGFLQDILDGDEMGIQITKIHVGNPYNVIDVNLLSEDERKSLLLHTELDIHCIADHKYEVAIEMQLQKDKFIEYRIFNNSSLKYTSNYDNIFYNGGGDEVNEGNKKKRKSKYAGLISVISLNIFGHHHFKKSQKALHVFRMYDVDEQKYTLSPNRYVEIYFELMKQHDHQLSKNLKAWRHFMLTGDAVEGSPSYVKEAAEMMKISNLTPEERRIHEIYKKNRQKVMSREAYVYDLGIEQGHKQGHEQGHKQGHEQGIEQNKLDTAKRLLAMGLSIGDVMKGADLDYSIVHKLA